MFIRFGATHERDGRTDRQTDRQTPHGDIGRAYVSRRAAKTRAKVQQYSDCYMSTLCRHKS